MVAVHSLKDIADKADKAGDRNGAGGDFPMPVDGEKLSTDFHGLYHEKQIGALCAVHAINNLMQQRRFDEIELSEIAIALDAAEREALGGGALSGESESGNVRADGFFSVQVILRALQNAGLAASQLAAEAARDPAAERGFVFNRREHWFCLRKVSDEWFDFNSMFATPKHMSRAHLNLFFEAHQNQGYDIFVVRGAFPASPLERDRRALAAAVRACEDAETASAGGTVTSSQSQDPNFAAFSGSGQALAPSQQLDPELAAAAANDPELATAIAMSLSEAAPPPQTEKQKQDEMRRKRLARFG